MTPGNNGASTPEDDDPFGYLYADGQANGAQPPSGGYGYPNAVNRVRTVGERQYGQQSPAGPPSYGQVPQQQGGGYGQQPSAHYAAPETFPGAGAPTAPQQPARGGGRGRGPNTKGLLIGAVAVVAAVVIGIGVAMMGGDEEQPGGDTAADSTPSQQAESGGPSPSAESSVSPGAELPVVDVQGLQLAGSAAKASDVAGAQADGGTYVGGLNQVGSSVTWTVNGIPEDGTYTVFARYSAVGDDQEMTLTINGKPFGSKLNLSNFTGADDPAKGWTDTYAWPTLSKGTNTISVSCNDGDKCDVLLDQFWLKKGQVTS
ncbi:carbohydrate-binding protein [Streptomyces sp. NPDC048290]|uniref:carbohydrate-binding protein n=1 Tax=Streptomyces sp. NPDC048290 TaxID=3155811 RepID=UPI00342A9D9D